MAESAARSRWAGIGLLVRIFLLMAVLIEGYDLVTFAQTFVHLRTSWLAVRAEVDESSIGYRSVRSSGASRGAPGSILLYTVRARIRYAVDGQAYDAWASGADERYRTLAQWEQSGLAAGQFVPIRVNPDAPDKASLLGEWTPPSLIPFERFIGVELALLGGTVVPSLALRRRARRLDRP